MRKLLLRFAKLIFGLLLYAAGIALTIKANIGYGPWEVFHFGLAKTVGLTIGIAGIVVGLAIIVIIVLMGEKIGIGTILNMLLIGLFLDAILLSGILPTIQNTYIGMLVLIAGLYTISIGSYFYISSGFCAGPRDGLMVSLTRRTGLPIGVIRSIIELAAIGVGWLLGGMVGLGTVLYGLAIGFCVQSTFRLLRFNPAVVRHLTVAETFKEIKDILRDR